MFPRMRRGPLPVALVAAVGSLAVVAVLDKQTQLRLLVLAVPLRQRRGAAVVVAGVAASGDLGVGGGVGGGVPDGPGHEGGQRDAVLEGGAATGQKVRSGRGGALSRAQRSPEHAAKLGAGHGVEDEVAGGVDLDEEVGDVAGDEQLVPPHGSHVHLRQLVVGPDEQQQRARQLAEDEDQHNRHQHLGDPLLLPGVALRQTTRGRGGHPRA